MNKLPVSAMTSIVYICHPALLHRLLLLTLVVVGDATSAQVVKVETIITIKKGKLKILFLSFEKFSPQICLIVKFFIL